METRKSIFLSSCNSRVRLPVELTWGFVAFSRGATGLSLVPPYCKLILRVRVASVKGNQVYLEWTGTSGSSEMVERPLEFLSTFKLRPPPLDDGNARIPFPMKQGNGPSSRDLEGKMGFLLSYGGTLGVLLEWRWVCQGSSRVASSVANTLSIDSKHDGKSDSPVAA